MKILFAIIILSLTTSCATYKTVEYDAIFLGYDRNRQLKFKRVSPNVDIILKDTIKIITRVKS